MHPLRFIALALALGAGFAFAHAQEPVPLTLPDLFAEIRARHPALAAGRASTEAARARVSQEKAWMDPRLSIDVMREETTRLDTYSEVSVRIAQELPLSGRNALRAQAATAEVAVADAQTRRREWLLLNEARLAYFKIAATDERLALNAQLQTLLHQTRDLSRQAYETGLRPQMDLLGVETNLNRLEIEGTELKSLRTQETARLNALRLRPAETLIARLVLPTPAPPSLDLAEAVARARLLSPDLAIALKETSVAEARLALARKNRAIDPEIMFTARQMNGSGEILSSYDTGIAFNLPWLNPSRTRNEVREAQSRVTATRAETEANVADLAGQVSSLHARVAGGYRQILHYENELLPLVRSSAEAARRDYETGRAPLLAVLAAERDTREAEMKLADLRAEHALAHAEFSFLTSQDLAP